MAETQAHPFATVVRAVGVDDCWRRIGVRGDGSCPALAEHAHCRNCPTYAQAAAMLLDAQQLDQALQELPDAADDSGNDRGDDHAQDASALACLVFRIGEEWLALPTAALGEVTAPSPVHSLPHRRDAAVLGLAAVRGNLLACLSLAHLFDTGAAQAELDAAGSRFLILGQGRAAIALPVAEIAGIVRVRRAALEPLPATLARGSARYTQALFVDQGRSVGLLDAAQVRQALARSLA
ncbi:signal transducer, CheW-like protein [Cupriavidus taiwanensis]|uniref:Chemotaxis protein CheW n=1 Tax=Cupriavidus taiwanensis TaxID=164546 RepID=A0A976B235_9BURK|nr:chemotaxis protein CheW [Cupriavidus taiwanensis]SOZ66475.1 signal transducer, CheW-like protein [Cupriavidus taiwanensis]SOZ67272.1 signal transducer, CheW-like protein [Cupriavidus taiwanensis]SOZ70769.1 signal transducer, CheW-like protein [Cupriavidus taiwanensis]SPA08921.1 signal transducer, CheW-like protein [Cupriavidus taiwanensis]